MASMFNSLNIGYSGLNVAQNGINTVSHNISNADSEGYTRQRVVSAAATPLSMAPGNVGNGAHIMDIKRVFDNFVFDRYTDISTTKEYSDLETRTLEELSTYFPEVDGVGIKADLVAFYDMWQTFADNPDSEAIKVALATQTKTLTNHISYTQNQVTSLQSQLNEQLVTNVNEVNALSKQLASINKSIDTAESGGAYEANDLRDQRNVLERSLAKLIGAKPTGGVIQSNIAIDSSSNTKAGSYTLSVNGFNIVDGGSYHPIDASSEGNSKGFYELSYERQDAVKIPLTNDITGGMIGALLDLRGGAVDTTSGVPTDGIVQNIVSKLDAFAKGLIESTNNLYSQSSATIMESNVLDLDANSSIVNSSLNVNNGSFNLIVYDIDGNSVAKREINIDQTTVMTGIAGSRSIEGQIKAQVDDNGDGSANNDIDDFINFGWVKYPSGDSMLELSMDSLHESRGYRFAIEDVLEGVDYSSGSNFAGALGMNRYFDGDSAQNMELNFSLNKNPTNISAGSSPNIGNNIIALDMVQHQYEKFDFHVGDEKHNATTYAMFDVIATEVGSHTNAAILKNETISTQFNATELEYFSISKVSIDEEMTNLIKYQTAYGAAAKVITTIDQMMQTLLGIKQ